jgi:hypothetical protein
LGFSYRLDPGNAPNPSTKTFYRRWRYP